MNRNALLFALLMALAAAAPAFSDRVAVSDPNGKDFNAGQQLFYQMYNLTMQGQGQKLWLVKITGPSKQADGQTQVPVEVVGDVLGGKIEPFKTVFQTQRGRGGKFPSDKDGKLYMVPVWRQNDDAEKPVTDPWLLPIYMQQGFVEVSGADDGICRAASILFMKPENDKQRIEQANLVLEILQSQEDRVCGFTAGIMGYNSQLQIISSDRGDVTDRLAKLLLENKNEKVAQSLQRLYASAYNADVLPNDLKLLREMMLSKDSSVRNCTSYAMRNPAPERIKQLVPLFEDLFLGKEIDHTLAHSLMSQAGNWPQQQGELQPLYSRIARGEGPLPLVCRSVAQAYIYRRGDEKAARDLVLETMISLPTAVTFTYIAESRMVDVVPTILKAIRDGKLQWSGEIGLMLRVLTGRLQENTFQTSEDWNRWWTAVEKQGDPQRYVDNGFQDDETLEAIAALVSQLESGKYVERKKAREALEHLPLSPEIPSIRKALTSSDAETRNSLQGLLALREKASDKYLQALRQQAMGQAGVHVQPGMPLLIRR